MLICLWSFSNVKNLEPKRNVILSCLITLSLAFTAIDFLLQFSIVGNNGWAETETYRYCFKHLETPRKQGKYKHTICTWFNFVYYTNGILYIPLFLSLGIYLFATFKLFRLTNYVENNMSFRIKFEDNIEEEK